jgi:hypothetical protein
MAIYKVNETLSVVNKITDPDRIGQMSYQWLSDGVAIIGATQPRDVIAKSDEAKKISVAAY